MERVQLQQAAAMLRAGWFKRDYCAPNQLSVCIMGAVAFVRAAQNGATLGPVNHSSVWEHYADLAVQEDPALGQALLDEAREALKGAAPKVHKELARVSKEMGKPNDPGTHVCLTNWALIETGEEAAGFLERVAGRLG